jgi:hypothetical protein
MRFIHWIVFNHSQSGNDNSFSSFVKKSTALISVDDCIDLSGEFDAAGVALLYGLRALAAKLQRNIKVSHIWSDSLNSRGINKKLV